jgi:crotonobetainyl-CoA:carnitine CoA-transferase CaiB-like acyl-CoA transferase
VAADAGMTSPSVFEGVRVIDLTMGWAGPLATMLLADYGAEVLKVEGPSRLDWWRSGSAARPTTDHDTRERSWERSPLFNGVNRNKRSVVIDLNQEQGRALFRGLAVDADVVIESFSPRVMAKWGLTYDVLHEINPGLIMMALPAVGLTGPCAHYVGYASTTEAMAGIAALCGDPEFPILQSTKVADPLAGLNGAVALAMALYDRQRTGTGRFIEVAHIEAIIPLIGSALMEWVLNGNVRPRCLTGDLTRSPNGAYRTSGDDRWVVICVDDDDAWLRLCAAMRRPELADDPRFRDASARVAHRATVDALVTSWTEQYDGRDVMERLQRADVLAATVNNAADLLVDPQAASGFEMIEHPVTGTHPYPRVTVQLSATPGAIRRHAPLFGEDNDYVLRDVLGLDDGEIAALRESGAIADEPRLK